MFTVSSKAFAAGARIPKKHTGEGRDASPDLAWSEAPAGTVEFALVCDDPDAPTAEPWVHWVAYGIPAVRTGFPEGDAAGAKEGRNDFGRTGYGGPMPPKGHGTHHYRFTMYALSRPVTLAPGATKRELLAAIRGNVLAEATLVGTYER